MVSYLCHWDLRQGPVQDLYLAFKTSFITSALDSPFTPRGGEVEGTCLPSVSKQCIQAME